MMPFGLKNVRATYQHLANKIFMALIGKTKEVYAEDMVTKSVKEIDYVRDLEETFKILKHYGIKLNHKSSLSELDPQNFFRVHDQSKRH